MPYFGRVQDWRRKNHQGLPLTRQVHYSHCWACMARWENGDPELLASCYRRSVEIAASKGIETLVFPNISTGIYGYPIKLTAKVAVTIIHTPTSSTPILKKSFSAAFQQMI